MYRYTSDLHFHHQKVAVEKRGFASIEEHDEIILQNWNRDVRKDDIVFICGDLAMNWKNIEDKLSRMAGRKILITGNHDVPWAGNSDGWKHVSRYLGEGLFESITGYARRRLGKREFLLSHFPYRGDGEGFEQDRHTQYRLRDEGMWLVHGHTHRKNRSPEIPPWLHPGPDPAWRGRQIHVGADAWDLRPATEEEVITLMRDEGARG